MLDMSKKYSFASASVQDTNKDDDAATEIHKQNAYNGIYVWECYYFLYLVDAEFAIDRWYFAETSFWRHFRNHCNIWE